MNMIIAKALPTWKQEYEEHLITAFHQSLHVRVGLSAELGISTPNRLQAHDLRLTWR